MERFLAAEARYEPPPWLGDDEESGDTDSPEFSLILALLTAEERAEAFPEGGHLPGSVNELLCVLAEMLDRRAMRSRQLSTGEVFS